LPVVPCVRYSHGVNDKVSMLEPVIGIIVYDNLAYQTSERRSRGNTGCGGGEALSERVDSVWVAGISIVEYELCKP